MKNKSNLSFDYNEEDFQDVNEIDTLEVIKKLLRNKALIISITGLSFFISVIHALSLKRIWQGDFK
jgi:Chain length determinant protein.